MAVGLENRCFNTARIFIGLLCINQSYCWRVTFIYCVFQFMSMIHTTSIFLSLISLNKVVCVCKNLRSVITFILIYFVFDIHRNILLLLYIDCASHIVKFIT